MRDRPLATLVATGPRRRASRRAATSAIVSRASQSVLLIAAGRKGEKKERGGAGRKKTKCEFLGRMHIHAVADATATAASHGLHVARINMHKSRHYRQLRQRGGAFLYRNLSAGRATCDLRVRGMGDGMLKRVGSTCPRTIASDLGDWREISCRS